jgi:hypothetical protein
MALFLTRMATDMGVTLGSGADQDFTDIGGEAAEIQTAINQIKQLGVTTGTTATTYSPADNVTREQMAMFIDRLLAATAPGPHVAAVGAAGSGSSDTTTTNISSAGTTYNYTDIDSGVTYEGHGSIVDLYHLGVSDSAIGATSYRPADNMTRAEMATFITNALGHSNARPSGIHLQASHTALVGGGLSTHELHVSDRATAGSTGTEGTLIDLMGFKTVTTLDVVAFAATGVCSSAINAYGGSVACYIDNSDNVTDSSGNFEVALSSLASGVQVADGQTVQYWAWNAANGTTFLNGTHTTSSVTVSSTAGGDFVTWANTSHPYANTPTAADLGTGVSQAHYEGKMGSDVTITLQLASAIGTSALLHVAQDGCTVALKVVKGASGSTPSTIENTTATFTGGVATYVASKTDPTPLSNTAATYEQVTLSNPAGGVNTAAGCTEITGGFGDALGQSDATFVILWDDTARAVNTITAATTSPYVTASGLTAGANNTVTATVYDQYGVGVAATEVGLESVIDTATVSTFTVSRNTNSSGVATFGVNRVSAVSGKEQFHVAVPPGVKADTAALANAYWVIAPSATLLDTGLATSASNGFQTGSAFSTAAAGNGVPEAAWVVKDTANNKMVAHLNTDENPIIYTVYTYDSNDSFTVNNAAKTEVEWETAWAAIGAAANGILTAADDWHLSGGGWAFTRTTSYPSAFGWAG